MSQSIHHKQTESSQKQKIFSHNIPTRIAVSRTYIILLGDVHLVLSTLNFRLASRGISSLKGTKFGNYL